MASQARAFRSDLDMMASEQHVRKRRKLDISEHVHINVYNGDEKKSFSVPLCFLNSSDFFQACLSQDWIENASRTINLEETEPEIFEAYLEWLYTKAFEVYCIDAKERVMFLIKSYILGDVLQDMAFRNTIMDQMLLERNFFHGDPDVISAVYEHLPKNNKLPLYVLHLELTRPDFRRRSLKSLVFDLDKIPKDYLISILKGSTTHPPKASKLLKYNFHEHNDKVPQKECPLCRIEA